MFTNRSLNFMSAIFIHNRTSPFTKRETLHETPQAQIDITTISCAWLLSPLGMASSLMYSGCNSRPWGSTSIDIRNKRTLTHGHQVFHANSVEPLRRSLTRLARFHHITSYLFIAFPQSRQWRLPSLSCKCALINVIRLSLNLEHVPDACRVKINGTRMWRQFRVSCLVVAWAIQITLNHTCYLYR